MRIIAGTARGTHIQAPEGMETRPVTDKIRQSLFNIWQFDIDGSRFLDVFSGSGSMALEAVSRGADKAVMIEKSPAACNVIRNNIKTCHFENRNMDLLDCDVFDAIRRLENRNEQFDFIYADPPYTVDAIFEPTLQALAQSSLLAEDGILAIRMPKEKNLPVRAGKLRCFRQKIYGISKVCFYRAEE